MSFRLERPGEGAISWTEESCCLSGPASFEVGWLDLDADGADEVVVAIYTAVTMGVGPRHWKLCAIDGARRRAQPACIDVADFGSLGYFVRSPESKECLLLQTEWKSGSEPNRGDGLYLVGRLLRFDRGKFVSSDDSEVFTRRLLFSFERERIWATDPILWFRDERARAVRCPDPLCFAAAEAEPSESSTEEPR